MITRVRVGQKEYMGAQAVGRAVREHFTIFSRRGPRKQWTWSDRGATQLTSNQQEELIQSFSARKPKPPSAI